MKKNFKHLKTIWSFVKNFSHRLCWFYRIPCCRWLVKKGHIVYGIDNIDDYYDINLKKDKLKLLKKNKNFFYKKIDISNKNKINHFLKKIRIDSILNLAGQAGVRYSIENPRKYYNSNITGFFNLIEIARIKKVRHFISASTSSVYGENKTLPFKENHHVDNIIILQPQRNNGIQVYSKVYNMKFTFAFFTVYGLGLVRYVFRIFCF